MSTGWVAGTVRAHALARRRLGTDRVAALATEPGTAAAVAALAATGYGHDVSAAAGGAEAQHAVGAALLWQLRVLAGWVPLRGSQLLRVLAGGFEIANVDEHLARLEGRPTEPPYALGTLETAWTRLASTRTPDRLLAELAASPWGAADSASAWDVHMSMTLAWAERVADVVPAASGWARAGAALTVVREAVTGRRPTHGSRLAARVGRLLGPGLAAEVTGPAPSVERAVALLPRAQRPLWAGVTAPEDLWRVEAAWLRTVAAEGADLAARAGYRPEIVVGTVAVLAVDAWRTRAALALAAGRGARRAGVDPVAAEVLDALA